MCIRDRYGGVQIGTMAFPHLQCCKFLEKQILGALAKPLTENPVSALSRDFLPEQWNSFFNFQRRSLIGRQSKHWYAEMFGEELEKICFVLQFLADRGGEEEKTRWESLEMELSLLHDGFAHVLVEGLKREPEDMDLRALLEPTLELELPCWQSVCDELGLEQSKMLVQMAVSYLQIGLDELHRKERTTKFNAETVASSMLAAVHVPVREMHEELIAKVVSAEDGLKAEYDKKLEEKRDLDWD
eukprot:TRINITY_DN1320_c0_g1_i1.p1 TRINITY_DN1320_c0_g1~~TRINITY_DN1320_c0_g1_i1.p1  ORF type:complete len:243 (-),score=74.62 TRINITY_DN1320_c0_g1_i1:138-866(-)